MDLTSILNKTKKILTPTFLILLSFIIIPSFALAQVEVTEPGTSIACQAGTTGFSGVLCTLANILNAIIPVLVSLGVVYFVWGVVQYMIGGGEEAKKKGKDRIIYGIIGLAVIVSIWGIVSLATSTFGVDGVEKPGRQGAVGLCNTSSGILNPPTDPSTGRKVPAFQHFAGYINCTIRDAIIPFLFAVALGVFIWGVVKFFFINSDEEAKRTQGKQFMIWGIVSLAVMISVWGLVNILKITFGIEIGSNGATIGLPQTQE